MGRTTLLELHCHSSLSDGYFAPEALVDRLAAEGVRYAALTDHDTIEGYERFRVACARKGIGTLSGVEISVMWRGRETHFLAYGFDTEHDELLAALQTIRDLRRSGAQPFTERMGRLREAVRPREPQPDAPQSAREGPTPTDLFRMVHEAGGRVFLAHPLIVADQREELEGGVLELKGLGLDGIEALYKPYEPRRRGMLVDIARKHDLLICGGSDYHGNETPQPATPGFELPTPMWRRFRDSLGEPGPVGRIEGSGPSHPSAHHVPWRGFFLRILMPTLLSIALFVWLILAYILPTFEQNLLQRKREMIRELTNSAVSVIAEYHHEARRGSLSMSQAKQRALERVRAMRYGPESLDYFWITDMQPILLMHPYRPDLVGTDVSQFTDPNGVRLFVEFVNVVRRQGSGYVEYVWQWKDDPDRLAPKESYVQFFEPWGWVIGTGLYMEDVRAEIASLTERLVNASFVIFLIVTVLLSWVAHQSLKAERRRRWAEEELSESHERYRALVEAASEGTMMVLGERCTYSNRVMRRMLGVSAEQFALLEIDDILPDWSNGQSEVARYVATLEEGGEAPAQIEARLLRRDGKPVDALLSITRVRFAGQDGWIVNAKDIGTHKKTEEQLGESREKYRVLTENIPLGVFRVDIEDRGRILEVNAAAARILGIADPQEAHERRLWDYLEDEQDEEGIVRNLRTDGSVRDRIVRLRRDDGSMPVCAVSGILGQDATGQARYFDGILEDITERKRNESERDAMMAQLQSSLLFLNEPVKHVVPDLLSVDMNLPIRAAAREMTEAGRSAAAVVTGEGNVIGLVTEHDVTARAMAAGLDPSRPVCEIMSAPIVSVSDSALAYEALLLMQERGFRHVAVRDTSGKVTGLIQNKELMQFHRYSATAVTLGIQQAQTVREICALRERVPELVKMLIDCGAKSRHVTRIITAISDTILNRFVGFAISELGAPPVPFAFVALGSEGREEQTLATDQDNAIVFEDTDDPQARAYFEQLGAKVCDWLNDAGYVYCKADMMARNPKWCQPLAQWKHYFSQWIGTDDPRDFLDINIFFDFRCVHGVERLTNELATHIHDAVHGKAAFFYHFAQTVLLYKPPVGMFGQIVMRSQGDAPKTLDIKAAMNPIVNFARIYALRHRIEEVNTTDRLLRLVDAQVLTDRTHEEMLAAYDYLMQMRLAHQARRLTEGKRANNSISPKEMTPLDETMVKETFTMISAAQKKISGDFLGSV